MAMRMRRGPPVPRLSSCAHGGRASHACPTRPATTVRAGRSPWLDVDWREHQRWVTIDGRRVNVVELGSGPPLVFIHGLSGSWQNWLEQLPVLRPRAPRHRLRPARLRRLARCPREKITISGYGRFVDALLDELGVEQRRGGRQLDGRLHRHRARDPLPRSASSASCSSAPRACRSSTCATSARSPCSPRSTTASPAYSGWLASRSDALARRPGARRMIFGIVAAPPRSPARPARRRAGPRLGQARLRAGPRRAHRLPDPRPPGRDRLPDADRLGRRGQARPARATPTSSRA